jgi:hypothetical protein
MKKLNLLLLLATLTTTGASAQQLFDPNFSSGLPAGYTTTTNTDPAGTFTTGSDGLTVADFSQPGPYVPATASAAAYYQANNTYVTATGAAPESNSITSNFTFTPTYTLQGNGGGQGNITVFSLTTAATPTPLFSVTLQPFTYTHTDNLIFSAGVQYNANSADSGNGYFDSSQGAPTLGSLSGVALTVDNVTTSTDLGPDSGASNGFPVDYGDRYEIEDKGTVSEGSTILFSYDVTRTEDTTNGYDPVTGALTLDLGIINGSSDGTTTDTATNYFAPGANIDFSSVDVEVTAPEPSTYALLLGGLGVLVLAVRRRLVA